jgi:hypothetical protein
MRLISILERQVNEMHANASITHEPALPSHLLRSESVSEDAPPALAERASESVAMIIEETTPASTREPQAHAEASQTSETKDE